MLLPERPSQYDEHAWHLFPIRLTGKDVDRSDFIDAMSKAGIGCSVHFIPLHLQPYWMETYNLSESNFPNAQNAYEREVSIPLYTKMTEDDQTRVILAIKQAI